MLSVVVLPSVIPCVGVVEVVVAVAAGDDNEVADPAAGDDTTGVKYCGIGTLGLDGVVIIWP
jgi:hypothetical protein